MINKDINLLDIDYYEEIRYILACNIRTKLMFILLESDKSYNQIKNILSNQKKPNILRAIRQLKDKNYLNEINQRYSLTNKGLLIAKNMRSFIDSMYFINAYDDFWKNHRINNIPHDLIRYVHIFDNSKLIISDTINYNKPINLYVDKIQKSKNLQIVLPIYSQYHIRAILECLENNNAMLQLVTRDEILNIINNSEFKDKFFKLMDNNQIKLYVTDDDIDMFYTVADNFYSLSLFYLDKTFDESSMFYSENMEHMDELKYIFDVYKANLS